MPITRLTCPHCEQEVDLNLTSVTRSRDCPLCGRYIILQFTTRASRVKRKALLMPTVELEAPATVATQSVVTPRPRAAQAPGGGPEVVPRRQPAARTITTQNEPADVAQTLEGSSGERLQNDPEVGRMMRKLLMGVAVMLSVIGLLIAADRLRWWDHVAATYAQVILALSPPKSEAQTQAAEADTNPKLPSKEEVLSRPSVPMPDAPVSKPGTGVTGALSEQEKAMRAVAAFLAAKSLDERMPMIRDAGMMEPTLRRYYETHDAGPIAFREIQAREVNPEGILSFAFNVILANGESRRVVVAKSGGTAATGGDRYVLDWSSFVLYSELSWEALMTQRPTTATLLRVRIREGGHFNDQFRREDGLMCVELMNPLDAAAQPVYAYIRNGSPLAGAISLILRRGSGEPQPVTVTVHYPEGASANNNQVWMGELVSDGWLVRGR